MSAATSPWDSWADKYRRGELTDEIDYAERAREAEAKIAALGRKSRPTDDGARRAQKNAPGDRLEQRANVDHLRACGDIPIAEECRLMNLARSTYYKTSAARQEQLRQQSEDALSRAIENVVDDWPAYGYRR